MEKCIPQLCPLLTLFLIPFAGLKNISFAFKSKYICVYILFYCYITKHSRHCLTFFFTQRKYICTIESTFSFLMLCISNSNFTIPTSTLPCLGIFGLKLFPALKTKMTVDVLTLWNISRRVSWFSPTHYTTCKPFLSSHSLQRVYEHMDFNIFLHKSNVF